MLGASRVGTERDARREASGGLHGGPSKGQAGTPTEGAFGDLIVVAGDPLADLARRPVAKGGDLVKPRTD